MAVLFLKELRFHAKDFKLLLLVPLFILLSYLAARFNTAQYLEREKISRAMVQKADEELHTTLAYGALAFTVSRVETPLCIFYNGATSQFGRNVRIAVNDPIEALQPQPAMGRNPYLSRLFRLDWVHIVIWLFSLLAILMGHDIISREKEEGTLRLLSVSRLSLSSVVAVKLAAAMSVLVLCLSASMAVSWLPLILRNDVSVAGTDVLCALALWICAFWYGAFWLLFSCYLSYWTLSSSKALMAGLLFWMLCVLGMPALRTRVMGNPYFETENARWMKLYQDDWNSNFYRLIGKYFEPLWQRGEFNCSHCSPFGSPAFLLNQPTWDAWLKGLEELEPCYRKRMQRSEVETMIWKPILEKDAKMRIVDYLNPSGLMEMVSGRLTDMDMRSYIGYLREIRQYLFRLDSYLNSRELYESPLWFGPETAINHLYIEHPEANGRTVDIDLEQLKEPFFKEMERLLSLRDVIDVNDLPRFQNHAEPWSMRMAGCIPGLLMLILLNGLLLSVLFLNIKGHVWV